MGYSAYAILRVGVPCWREDLFTRQTVKHNICDQGHWAADEVPSFSPPKFCSICGSPIRSIQVVETPTPAVDSWLQLSQGKDPSKMDADEIWEFLNENPMGVFCADNRTSCEDTKQSWAFGKKLFDIGPESSIAGHYGPTSEELRKALCDVETEAAKIGLKGQARVFVQLYESY